MCMCSCDYQEQGKFQNRTLLYQGPQSKFQSEGGGGGGARLGLGIMYE